MSLVDGINHVAFVTNDLERLSSFYKRVFGAEIAADMHDRGVRHALIQLGPKSVIHPFEFPESDQTRPGDMFERGRLDHMAINASSPEAFEEIRKRLVDEGASDGTVTDFGSMVNVFFRDPDGMEAEVCLMKDGVSLSETRHPDG